ncbi:hypothetical protein KUV50_14475 [Membranicola marinus]|uniref:Uncharacterized protein n=1 Tax=Membranihabitans marinus TaxID=1227546 RepID=A0A953LB40_9BACT|nr:hypothetical protein [Membranihabitans marinus]MBY5959353.1 hypothetical protein [Membranihabitans marinus]
MKFEFFNRLVFGGERVTMDAFQITLLEYSTEALIKVLGHIPGIHVF